MTMGSYSSGTSTSWPASFSCCAFARPATWASMYPNPGSRPRVGGSAAVPQELDVVVRGLDLLALAELEVAVLDLDPHRLALDHVEPNRRERLQLGRLRSAGRRLCDQGRDLRRRGGGWVHRWLLLRPSGAKKVRIVAERDDEMAPKRFRLVKYAWPGFEGVSCCRFGPLKTPTVVTPSEPRIVIGKRDERVVPELAAEVVGFVAPKRQGAMDVYLPPRFARAAPGINLGDASRLRDRRGAR